MCYNVIKKENMWRNSNKKEQNYRYFRDADLFCANFLTASRNSARKKGAKQDG